jgi:hypothetical protein
MRRRVHVAAHWVLTLLVPTTIVGTTVWFDFHSENVLIADHVWKFVRLTVGGLLVAAGVGAINAVRRRASWPYIAKLVVYSMVTAGTGAYAMVLADYTRFEKVNYIRLLHDAGFLFLVAFVAIGVKHLEALHYKRGQLHHEHQPVGEV